MLAAGTRKGGEGCAPFLNSRNESRPAQERARLAPTNAFSDPLLKMWQDVPVIPHEGTSKERISE